MPKIISASRRTDIPAFYGDWLMKRVSEGVAGFVNPFSGQKYLVSLKPDDVIAFVFWSKNFAPFMISLAKLKEMGYKFYFNYTITGLPNIFECNLVERDEAINNLIELSNQYSPKHINWRYDPIVISSMTDYDFHIRNFEEMCKKLNGYVERCYFSFAIQYGKVKRNFDNFQKENSVTFTEPEIAVKQKLSEEMAAIAKLYGIRMYTCCADILLNRDILKAHCVDGEIINELYYRDGIKLKETPTRKECGCTSSTDIGVYDSCPHGCIYCYANINKEKAKKVYENYDIDSAFLGYSKKESDIWVNEIETKAINKGSSQLSFF